MKLIGSSPDGIPELSYLSPGQGGIIGYTQGPKGDTGDTNTASATNAATSKATPVDGDVLPLADSAASFGLKKLSWANLKLAIGLYYNSLTATLTNKTINAGRYDQLNTTNGGTFLLPIPVTNSVNYWQMTPGATGAGAGLFAVGTDTDVSANIYSKGVGSVNLRSPGYGVAFQAQPVVSGVNYVAAYGSATGVDPILIASGADANIHLDLRGKGAGVVKADGVEVATISGAQTLTNKSISGASNTLSNIPQSAVTSLTTDLAARQTTAQKGVANGYASLDSTGKLPTDQMPSVVSVLSYRGTWNASTNSPTLANGTGTAGHTYRVDAAGTALGSTFAVGDYVIYTGSVWQKSLSTDDATRNAVERTAVATLTNKTLTSPVVATPTITGAVTTTSLAQSVASGTSNYLARPVGPRSGYGTSNVSFVPGVHNYLTNLVERGCSVTITQNGTPLAGVNVSQMFRGLENAGTYTVLTGAVNDIYVIEADITAISTGNGTNWGGTSGIIYDNGPARNTKIEWFYNGAWNTVYESLNNPTVFHWGGSGGQQSSPVTKIRWTLISNATSMFIVELFHNSLYSGNVTKWLPATGGSVYGSAALPPTLQAAGADANIDLDLKSKGTGAVEANGIPVVTTTGAQTLTNKTVTSPTIINPVIRDTTNNELLEFVGNSASVNHVRINNQPTGGSPIIAAHGDDTNIGLNLIPKGTGVVFANSIPVVTTTGAQTLSSKTLTQPAIQDSLGNNVVGILQRANAVNYLQFRATEAAGSPAIFAAGTDTNIGFTFVPKGSGTVQIYTATESSATLQATGAGTTIGLDLVSKGSGSVTVNGNHAVNKTAAVPATATSTGIVGQVAYDSTWFYVCTATNTWRRAALSTW